MSSIKAASMVENNHKTNYLSFPDCIRLYYY